MELISSKNRVPPLASSNSPFLSDAPVYTPFTVPKSIPSNRLSGMAAQLMAKMSRSAGDLRNEYFVQIILSLFLLSR